VRPSNFLLLDEPTNHLDLRAKDVLLEALANYTGTVVFVSHDRYFIDKLATRVFEIAGGEVNVYPGNYEDYLWRKEGKEITLDVSGLEDLIPKRAASPSMYAACPPPKSPGADEAVKTKRVNPIRLEQMKDRCREIEDQVARLEAEIEGCAQELAHFRSAEDSVRLTKSIERCRQDIANLMREWEETAKLVEAQEAEAG